jgi:hypothetical protein
VSVDLNELAIYRYNVEHFAEGDDHGEAVPFYVSVEAHVVGRYVQGALVDLDDVFHPQAAAELCDRARTPR